MDFDMGGLLFSALIIVLLPFGITEVRKRQGLERTFGTVGMVAAFLYAIVGAANSLGWLRDGPVYATLRISLVVLFWAMFFLFVRGRRTA